MKLPKVILVPTDFSEGAKAALDYAVALAAKLDARITLLNVVAVPLIGVPEVGVAYTADVLKSLLEGNQQLLDKLVADNTGKAAFGPTLLETGDARAQIEAAAEKLGADLIVMGTHGRRGVKRMLLGSVAEMVVRVAPCPVLLVRQEAS
jgi:nucleotide-binding universal stress UspA family protein